MLTTNGWGGKVVPLQQQKGDIVKEIVLTRNVFIKGKPYKPGDKVKLPESEAKYLVNIGKAEWRKVQRKKETADSKAAANSEKR